MYTDYVGNFDKATETLSLWTKKLPTMAALIDEIQVSYRTQDTYSLPMYVVVDPSRPSNSIFSCHIWPLHVLNQRYVLSPLSSLVN